MFLGDPFKDCLEVLFSQDRALQLFWSQLGFDPVPVGEGHRGRERCIFVTEHRVDALDAVEGVTVLDHQVIDHSHPSQHPPGKGESFVEWEWFTGFVLNTFILHVHPSDIDQSFHGLLVEPIRTQYVGVEALDLGHRLVKFEAKSRAEGSSPRERNNASHCCFNIKIFLLFSLKISIFELIIYEN